MRLFDATLAVSPPTRGVAWVLRTAAALSAAGVWLVVLLQLTAVAAAERQLDRLVREANQFAELPAVRPAELQAFVHRRAEQVGWPAARLLILPDVARPQKFHVVQVELPAAAALPRVLRPLAIGIHGRTLRAGSYPGDDRWPLMDAGD